MLVRYKYDAYGKPTITYYNGGASTAVVKNPFLFRGYYYDQDLKLYYLSARYYDPGTGRFISPDRIDTICATPGALTDKNLYAYCDNNPVMRRDDGGQFWDTVFDVISLGASIIEVCINPYDPWAWAGAVGDAIDLIPFLSGVGEATKAVKVTRKIVDNGDDVIDAAKALKRGSELTSDVKKATGSYEIIFESGKNYVGKGGFGRAIESATEHSIKEGKVVDKVTAIRWKSAPTARDAFIDEFLMQKRVGVLSENRDLIDKTYNKIWSPGRKYYGN